MKRAALLLVLVVVLVLVLVLGVLLARRANDRRSEGTHAQPSGRNELVNTSIVVTAISDPAARPPGHTTPLLGETILRDYANTNLPPENDLTLMSRLMENSLLLLKSAANRPLSANEDWADLLRGKNTTRERFLPDQHISLNSHGQLVDRWGTPLFFHALGGGQYELRSAGPDGKLWTVDDVHRNADGSFRRGAELNAPSLLDAANSRHLPAK